MEARVNQNYSNVSSTGQGSFILVFPHVSQALGTVAKEILVK